MNQELEISASLAGAFVETAFSAKEIDSAIAMQTSYEGIPTPAEQLGVDESKDHCICKMHER